MRSLAWFESLDCNQSVQVLKQEKNALADSLFKKYPWKISCKLRKRIGRFRSSQKFMHPLYSQMTSSFHTEQESYSRLLPQGLTLESKFQPRSDFPMEHIISKKKLQMFWLILYWPVMFSPMMYFCLMISPVRGLNIIFSFSDFPGGRD